MTALEILKEYHVAFYAGGLTTAFLFFLSMLCGTFLGLVFASLTAVFGYHTSKLFDWISLCLAAIPPIVTLYWIHYPFQTLITVELTPFQSSLITLTIINAFAVYRIAADTDKDFPFHYQDAAKVCGMSARQTFLKITLPIKLRMGLPRWIDQQVVILHSTVFASLIAVGELFRVAQRINSKIYEPIAIYTAMALIFLVTTGPMLALSRRLRSKWFPNLSQK